MFPQFVAPHPGWWGDRRPNKFLIGSAYAMRVATLPEVVVGTVRGEIPAKADWFRRSLS